MLLRASAALAALGYPVFLSASNKRFLGALLDLEVGERREATIAAHALGITLGCRILRAHDVKGARRTADVLAALLEAAGMSVHLLRGGDPALLAEAVSSLVHELVGDEDRALVVDDITEDDYEVARIVDAAQTPPFLTSRRVVVARHVEQFTRQDDVAPSSTTSPIRSTPPSWCWWPAARCTSALVDAVKKQKGEITDTDPGRAGTRAGSRSSSTRRR